MKYLLLLSVLITLASCTDSTRAKLSGYGNKYRVEFISGGQIIRTYTSTGKVHSVKESDGYYFMDAQTGKLVELSGEVIITQID